ncbi:MAG: hypothetical protein NTW83_06720, partial [Cyanobacteria bacterium]|nr:hypothetical protein [Cyanobacteriota bacterium]
WDTGEVTSILEMADTAERLYGEQWLFHGPFLQALAEVGRFGPRGIEGTIRVLPRTVLTSKPS